jgi:MFS transporter, PPP family, 3-phenylpropionic acid transporter
LRSVPYWRLAGFYFFYFAFVGAFSPYWGLYLRSLSLTAGEIGVLMSLLQVIRIFAPNLWGWAADRSGARVRVIQVSSALSVVAFTGVFLGSSFAWLFAVMAVMSFFWGGSLPLVEATTLTYLGAGTARYGRIRLWGSVGFVLAVVSVGAWLDRFPMGSLPWILLGFLVGILACAQALPLARSGRHEQDRGSALAIVRRPEVAAFFIACFFMTVAHGPLYVFFSIYLVDHGYSKSAVGVLWALGVVCEILVFLYLPQLFGRFSLRMILIASFAIAAVRFLLIGWAVDSVVLMTVAQVMHAATFGAYHCAALALVHRYFEGARQAQGQALYSSLTFGAGGALGGLLSGYTWQRWGAPTTFSLAAAAALLGLLYLLRRGEPEQGNSREASQSAGAAVR